MQKQKVIFPEPSDGHFEEWKFSPAVESNGFVYVSGCTGTMADGSVPEGIKAQTRQAFLKIKRSLDVAGLTFSDIVEMTTYHVGLNKHLAEFREAKDEYIIEPYPAWTAVGASELASAQALIEIQVVAQGRNS